MPIEGETIDQDDGLTVASVLVVQVDVCCVLHVDGDKRHGDRLSAREGLPGRPSARWRAWLDQHSTRPTIGESLLNPSRSPRDHGEPPVGSYRPSARAARSWRRDVTPNFR